MQNVRYTVMYRLLHPETNKPITNTDEVEPYINSLIKVDTSKRLPILWRANDIRPVEGFDKSPDVVCVLSKEIIESVDNVLDPDYYGYTAKVIKINVPGDIWVVYNSYQSLTDCAKAVEKLAHAFGAENLKIVKEVDHRLVFQIG